MAAGMEVIKISRQMFHEFQILFQHLGRKTGDAGVCGTGVQRVGGVCQQRSESVVPR